MVGPPPDTWEVDAGTAGAREVLPGVWRVRLPLPWEGVDHVNAFAIEGDDGLVLVDCGSAGDASLLSGLEEGLAACGHALSNVAMLVLTHAHSDHFGLARAVRERSGASVWLHPDAAHFHDAIEDPEGIAAARERRSRQEGVPEALIPAFRDVREEVEGALGVVVPDHALVEGAVVPSGLGDWHVVETPGHCPSHVCLIQRERRLALVGDVLCVVFHPWIDYGYSHDPYADSLAALDRLEAELPLELALPGHGRPLADVAAVIADHRAQFEERLARTLAAVEAGPAGAFEISRRVFGDTGSGLDAVGAMTEVAAYLRHLRLRELVARDADADGRFLHRRAGV